LPSFYRRYGGAVVSTSIDKSVYVTVNKKFDNRIRVSYSKTEEVGCVQEIDHKLVRESLCRLGIAGGIEITSISDIPSKGSGLGTSSSFTVGLLHALYAYQGRYVSAEDLARESCTLEIDICGEPIGKQDQYAAAYGGFNFITFKEDDTVSVDPIICLSETIERIQAGLISFYTGVTRSASDVLRRQNDIVGGNAAKQRTICRMVRLAYTLRDEVQKNNVEAFGELLHENWVLKKSLTEEISNSVVDGWYKKARDAGASGGKLLGAGGGGFLIFYAPPEDHEKVGKALSDLRRVDMRFNNSGSSIIFYR